MRRLGLLVAVALVTAGCGLFDLDQPAADPAITVPATVPATPPGAGDDDRAVAPGTPAADQATTAPPRAEPGPWTDLALTLEVVAEVPGAIALAHRSGTHDLYVAERSGRVWRVGRTITPAFAERWEREPQVVIDIRDEVSTGGERGLLGIAFSTDGRTLYLSYTDLAGDSVLEAVDVPGEGADLDSRRVLLRVDQPHANHNGGHVVLGPDGFLYWGLGDGGGAGDPHGHGQDPSTLLGSVLRIDPFPSGDRPYSAPAGNPFTGPAEGDGAPEVWLWGVRNPWRFSFDRATGDLWLADVGQHRWEEVNLLTSADHQRGRGANLGWAAMEGLEPFEGGTEPADHHPPIFVYPNDAGRCSVTGGVVYRGWLLEALQGVYVYGDYCRGELRGLEVTDGGVAEAGLGVRAEPGQLVSFGEDAAGELFVLELSGRVSRLTVDLGDPGGPRPG
jgi:glucose/arabinose dehydrogenase